MIRNNSFRLLIFLFAVGLPGCAPSTSRLKPSQAVIVTAPASTPIGLATTPPLQTAISTVGITLTPTTLPPTAPTGSPAVSVTQFDADIQVWARDIYREGREVKATVCFELPDGSDWVVDQAVLRYNEGEASLVSTELLELLSPSASGEKGHRCDEVAFVVPEQADFSNITLIINKLRAIPGEAEYCKRYMEEAQPTLEARQSGIEIECTQVSHGFNLSVVAKPASLSQQEADRIVYDFYTVSGPWTFQFDQIPAFIFDPLPYAVKAKASNYRREGDTIQVDVCAQIDNNAWDAWRVQEAILTFGGQEDRYFGTDAPLRRISPAGAQIGSYCGTLVGDPSYAPLPETAEAADFTLTITSLVPEVDNGNICTTYLEQVQQKLDEQRTGIQAQCGKTSSGSYGLLAAGIPPGLTLSEAAVERLLGKAGSVLFIQGPWQLSLK